MSAVTLNSILIANVRRCGRHKGRACQRGAETVELALTLGFFLIILFSFLIGVFLLYANSATDYLAREGVQFALKRGSEMATDTLRVDAGGVQDPYATEVGIRNYLNGKGLLSPITVNVCWLDNDAEGATCSGLIPGENNDPGDEVQVTVTHNFHPPLFNSIWPTTITLAATSRGVIQF